MSALLARALIGGLLALDGFRARGSVDLFVSGTGGYNTYRGASLYETLNGTLLAFCDGHVDSSSDTGNVNVVLRRSFDGGVTWAAEQLVWSDGANTCGNQVVVQDRSTGRIWLFMTWNNGADTQAEIMNGTSIDVRKIYSCYSDDDGATWSVPVNRFSQVQNPDTRWDATGPGRGIQMVNGAPGRLIIPANGRNIQSDDHGVTWSQSAWLPGGSSESQEVEISGGVLLRNDRATGGNTAYNARIFCRSSNQGASWGALEIRQDLVDPICQASTIAVNHPAGLNGRMLVFSNPSSTTRDHMTIYCSLDDGATWPFSHLVYSGSSAYSCLTGIGTTNIGLLYERDSYGRVTFDKFTYASLGPNAPTTNQPARTWQGSAGAGHGTWQQASNWDSNIVPIFDSGLDVVFNTVGAANLTNCIGGNRTIRSLNFNTNADGDIGIYLAEKTSSPATNYVLTFDGFLDNATNTVASGAAGSFTIGVGGMGSMTLASDLMISHNGSGVLMFARPINESATGRGISKDGTGTMILASSNTFSGTVTVTAGQLMVGANKACGTGPLVLGNGVTFASDTNASRVLPNNVTLAGNVTLGQLTGGTGALRFSGSFDLGAATRTLTINNFTTISGGVTNGGLSKIGSGTLTLSGANAYTGQTTIYAGVVQLGDGGGTGSLNPASIIAIGPGGTLASSRSDNVGIANNIAGTGVITKLTAAEVNVTGTNSFSGTVNLPAGTGAFAFNSTTSDDGQPAVIANGRLAIGSPFVGTTCTIGNLTGAGQVDPQYGSTTGTRTLQINQTTDGTFSGLLTDATSGAVRILALTKTGPATLTLSGKNTYTGGTTVSSGTLLVNGALGNTAVTVNGGNLGGLGTIVGSVNVQPGGTLSPGTNGVATLAISNSLTLAGTTYVEVNASNGQRDLVQGLTSVSYGGSLVVTNLAGTLTNGQTFQLFSASGTKTGNFTSITPVLTGGKAWSFNPTSGVLSVVATTASYPTNISFSFSGGMLSLTWPASHLGWFAQSNAASLASPGNWFDIAGSSASTSLNVMPSPERSNVFYRLRSP